MNRRNLVTGVAAVALAASISFNGVMAYQNNSLSETLIEKEKVISGMKEVQDVQQDRVDQLNKNLLNVRHENVDLRHSLKKTADKVDGLENDKAKLQEEVQTLHKEVMEVKRLQAKKNKPVVAKTVSSTKDSGRTITVVATAYTASCAGCSGTTATGINLRANPNAKVIAVDPSIIPLGSRVYLEGYGYAIAGDKGGAIKGHKVDVFIPNLGDAYRFGVRTVQLKILD